MIPEPRYIPDDTLVVWGTAPRSWRERLFTLPWQPQVKTKRVLVPSMHWTFQFCTFTYHGHSEALKKMRELAELHTRN